MKPSRLVHVAPTSSVTGGVFLRFRKRNNRDREVKNALTVCVALLATLLAITPALAQMPPLGGDSGGGGLFGGAGAQKVVSLRAEFTTATAEAPARLFITATIEPGWHIYSITQPDGGPVKTTIAVSPPAGVRVGAFQATTPADKKPEPAFDNLMVESHHGTVTWFAPLELPPGVDPAQLRIPGVVTLQACDASSCLPPTDYRFVANLGAGVAMPPPPKTTTNATATTPVDIWAVLPQLGFAFLGGLILNLMPCVLPVISLKVLSFLEQAGESRGRIFALNLWYSAGLLSVFMVLAALAAVAGLAWGEQFTLPWFKVAMTAFVFAMALSFLGVWEIPIPGFVGTGRSNELQTQEGPSGAFFKGIFTTILATPCSGPFLGPVFAYLLKQPPYMAYWIFGAVGLGMASPYLILGAFPHLIRRLPRPGAWMETVKQLMGFLLLGTVVYLFTTLKPAYFIPTLTLLIGLWFACWWIGRTPLTASAAKRATAWIGGLATAGVVGLLAFVLLFQQALIPWQPFSPEALNAARREGKTVLVDFSADWCLTCKANLKFAIETNAVHELIKANKVVPMLADWTDRSETIKKALNDLGYNSIPVMAIWPASSPDGKPIVLSDLLTEGKVLEALKQAGPSQSPPKQQETPAKEEAVKLP